MSSFDLSQIFKVAGEVLAFLILIKASRVDIKTREVPNKFPVGIVFMFALSAFGSWFVMPESMPITSIATQFVLAIGIGLLLLVVTVGIEKVQNAELFGGGDIKVIAATTLFLSVESFMAAMLASCILFVVGALFERRKFDSWSSVTLPFVPFWTAGFMAAIVATYVL